jgi:hypothetical protein
MRDQYQYPRTATRKLEASRRKRKLADKEAGPAPIHIRPPAIMADGDAER